MTSCADVEIRVRSRRRALRQRQVSSKDWKLLVRTYCGGGYIRCADRPAGDDDEPHMLGEEGTHAPTSRMVAAVCTSACTETLEWRFMRNWTNERTRTRAVISGKDPTVCIHCCPIEEDGRIHWCRSRMSRVFSAAQTTDSTKLSWWFNARRYIATGREDALKRSKVMQTSIVTRGVQAGRRQVTELFC